MITRKGLTNDDVFALFSEDGREVSLFIGIPDCEKFSISKTYATSNEALRDVESYIKEFIDSHKSTLFTLAVDIDIMTGEPTEEPVNDSWKSIFEDAKTGVQDSSANIKGKIKNRFNFL